MVPNKLVDLAKAKNTSIETLVRDAIAKGGSQAGAATLLGVSPNAVKYHVRRLGLKVKTTVKFAAKVEN
jgi:transcriptional regulator with GAF, ATPase, and Fis domain